MAMAARLILTVLSVLIFSYTFKYNIEVWVRGALRDIMHKGDMSSKISLKELSDLPNVYALGAAENLKGEIIIIKSKPYVGTVQKGHLAVDSTFEKGAALLVYSQVNKWISTALPSSIKSVQQLEEFVARAAGEKNINLEKPFPFMLSGKVTSADWHVIDWPAGDKEHTHEKHKKSGLHGNIANQEVQVLGFHSRHHHTIFTHHSTNMHLHLKTADHTLSAHVDDIQPGSAMLLWLPQ